MVRPRTRRPVVGRARSMSIPVLTVQALDRETWHRVRHLISRAAEPCTFAPEDCLGLDGHCECDRLTNNLLGPCPAPPAPEYRVDRSDGYGANVRCLAGDRVSVTFTGAHLRSADAIELGEALIAAGRYLQAMP